MPRTALLEEIAKDTKAIRNRLEDIRMHVSELEADIHPSVRHSYIRKLDRIEKKGKFKTYTSIKELKKNIEK